MTLADYKHLLYYLVTFSNEKFMEEFCLVFNCLKICSSLGENKFPNLKLKRDHRLQGDARFIPLRLIFLIIQLQND